MHNHCQETLIIEILSEIAQKKKRPIDRIKRLLLINKNPVVNRLFWEIIDKLGATRLLRQYNVMKNENQSY